MGTVGRKMPCGAGFNALPEECIANILSFTAPPDACRLSLVSSIFRSAAESDDVWDRFLPPDYDSIISRSDGSSPSVTPLKKKQLFFRLCDTPLLIDGGNKCFSLDKWTGKKCYMIAARELSILYGPFDEAVSFSLAPFGDTPWSWESLPQSRFAEVAELREVWRFEIRGKINTGMLSPETKYAAYLVYKFSEHARGFDGTPVHISVGIVGGERSTQTVRLDINSTLLTHWCIGPDLFNPAHALALPPSRPRKRGDQWLEIELGEYSNEGEADEELQMSLMEEDENNRKWGLIIRGIEIRPKRE